MNGILISRAPDNDVWGPFPQKWAVFPDMAKEMFVQIQQTELCNSQCGLCTRALHSQHSILYPCLWFSCVSTSAAQVSIQSFVFSAVHSRAGPMLVNLKSVHELELHICCRDIQIIAETPPGSTSYDNSGRWRVSSCSQVRGCSEGAVRADFPWGIQ